MTATTIYAYRAIVVSESERVIVTDEDTETIFVQNHINQWIAIEKNGLADVSQDLVLALGEMKRAAIALNKVMEVHRG